MSTQSNIEWTDATWNPMVGCTKVSPGCANCYAVGVSYRNLTQLTSTAKTPDGIATRDAHAVAVEKGPGGKVRWTGKVGRGGASSIDALTGRLNNPAIPGTPKYPGIDWVVLGGESGKGARPMHPDWARSVRDQCQAAGVPFFFKQWGEWAPATKDYGVSGSLMPDTGEKFTWIGGDGKTQNPSSHGLVDPVMAIARVGKHAAGRLLDGRTWDEFPAVEGVNHA